MFYFAIWRASKNKCIQQVTYQWSIGLPSCAQNTKAAGTNSILAAEEYKYLCLTLPPHDQSTHHIEISTIIFTICLYHCLLLISTSTVHGYLFTTNWLNHRPCFLKSILLWNLYVLSWLTSNFMTIHGIKNQIFNLWLLVTHGWLVGV